MNQFKVLGDERIIMNKKMNLIIHLIFRYYLFVNERKIGLGNLVAGDCGSGILHLFPQSLSLPIVLFRPDHHSGYSSCLLACAVQSQENQPYCQA